MRAAESLMTERHWREIRLDEVAVRAGVGKGTIYLHFEDKEDLFFQVIFAGFDELCAGIEARAGEGLPFERNLAAVCEEIRSFFRDRRAIFQSMQSEDVRFVQCHKRLRDKWMRRRGSLVDAVAGVLEHGQGQGRLRGDVPAGVLANFLLGMLRTRSRDLGEAEPRFQSNEFVLELFLNGAGPRAPAGAGGTGLGGELEGSLL